MRKFVLKGRHYHAAMHGACCILCHHLLIFAIINSNARMEDDSPSSLQSLALQARAFFSEIIGKDQKSPIPSTPGTVSSRASHDSDDTLLESAQTQSSIGITDFFSLDVIQMALHDPSISHQLLKFSQAQHCGENVEFVQKVSLLNPHSGRLQAKSSIH